MVMVMMVWMVMLIVMVVMALFMFVTSFVVPGMFVILALRWCWYLCWRLS